MRESRDSYFLKILGLVATRATCPRRQVAAMLVDKNGHILSTGYNGPPRGIPNCIDEPCPGAGDPPGDTRHCLAVHAEQNALLQCWRLDLAQVMYTTTAPCLACATIILNTPVKRVVVAEDYVDMTGWLLLERGGVRVEHASNIV